MVINRSFSKDRTVEWPGIYTPLAILLRIRFSQCITLDRCGVGRQDLAHVSLSLLNLHTAGVSEQAWTAGC